MLNKQHNLETSASTFIAKFKAVRKRFHKLKPANWFAASLDDSISLPPY